MTRIAITIHNFFLCKKNRIAVKRTRKKGSEKFKKYKVEDIPKYTLLKKL